MSIIIRISRDGEGQDYLFGGPGPVVIGGGEKCDLELPGTQGKLLEIKVSGGNIFVKNLAQDRNLYLSSRVLPRREEIRYQEGETLTLQDSSYHLTISRSRDFSEDPPPFFETEFKDRLEKMNFRIKEKESELRSLTHEEGKKRHDLNDLLRNFHKESQVRGKLSAEVEGLKAQKDILGESIRQGQQKTQEEEDKVRELRDYVKRLETDERQLKDNIVAQGLILRNLREERDTRSSEVEVQRRHLAELELEARKREDELITLAREYEDQEREIGEESKRVEAILLRNESAVKETSRIREAMAQVLKEKTLLDQEVEGLTDEIRFLEAQRKESQEKLTELRTELGTLETERVRTSQEVERQKDLESHLKTQNAELRIAAMKAEEKLSAKRGELQKIEFDSQDALRKTSTLSFEVERTTERLAGLRGEEEALLFKIRGTEAELNQLVKKSGEEKRALESAHHATMEKLGRELEGIRGKIDEAIRSLGEKEALRARVLEEIDELTHRQKSIQKETSELERSLKESLSERAILQGEMKHLGEEVQRLTHEKHRSERDFSALTVRILDAESELKEKHESARIELESLKARERAQIFAEKNLVLSEVEAFRQKSLAEVEAEYRRKEAELHQMRLKAQGESDQMLQEARTNLERITLEAEEREREAHARVKGAQDFLREKEKEAEGLINEARMSGREIVRKAELEIQRELVSGKKKVKGFLTMKREKAEESLQKKERDHEARLRRIEASAQEKFEDLKRREFKKFTKGRDAELEKLRKDLEEERQRTLKEINQLRVSQESEIEAKKKTTLDHIQESRLRHRKSWEEELQKEKDQFERSKRDRVDNATRALMNLLAADLEVVRAEDQLWKKRINETLEAAINGQRLEKSEAVAQIINMNPEDKKKIIPVLRKYTLRFGVPAAVATLVLADVGGVRSTSVREISALLRQKESAAELYADKQKEEWREKNTFRPQTTPGYKASYTDNVIYTSDFETVMNQEEFQNDWILKVHDFLVKDLELSEDVAISFISAESALLSELGSLRKDLHPKLLDQGVKKMRDTEAGHLAFLLEKIPDETKRERFSSFRRDYYDKYYNESFIPGRSVAGQP